MSDVRDPRLGDLIQPYSDAKYAASSVVIVGVPTDEGVRRNGGRVGAAQAPAEIRRALSKLTPTASNGSFETLNILDFGNITGRTLEEIHERAKSEVARFIRDGKIVIALGGGHDVTYPLASGFHDGIAKQDFALINVDAHLDVRERKDGLHHSGSSFRLLIEENILHGNHFAEFGIQQFAFAASHLRWIRKQGSHVLFYEDLSQKDIANNFRILLTDEFPFYLSFDIDSIRSNDAPGSSAPSPIGFRAEDALAMCFEAGRHETTRMLDIVEVNPLFDRDHRTSKLAARMIAWFLLGITERG